MYSRTWSCCGVPRAAICLLALAQAASAPLTKLPPLAVSASPVEELELPPPPQPATTIRLIAPTARARTVDLNFTAHPFVLLLHTLRRDPFPRSNQNESPSPSTTDDSSAKSIISSPRRTKT